MTEGYRAPPGLSMKIADTACGAAVPRVHSPSHPETEEPRVPFEHLRAPFQLASFKIPNRIVMPPMVVWKAAEDGAVTSAILDHYRDSLGPGMMIVEATVVSAEGRLARQQLGIFEDRHVEGLARIAAIIHAAGSAASIQLHHAGRNTNLENTFGLPLVAPSAVAAKGIVSEELTEDGIERILECFAAAARRAADAGFDAVEIHGAHGYLASQFLSPLANKREDRWGGSLENRARFVREAARRMRAAVGSRLPVSCRLGAAESDPGGLSVDEGTQVAKWLEEDGMPFLHVSAGIGSAPKLGPAGSPWSDRLLLGAAVRKAVGIPVIGLGGIRTPDQAERALAEGLVDLVGVGRAMLADPQWAAKTLAGRQDEIYLCRQCRVCHHFRHAERCPARKEAQLAAGLT
jgi:NADPH2 dehydrogenase